VFCKEVGVFDVILEGDAKQIVDEVNVAGPNLSIVGQFVEGIQAEIHGLRQALMVHVGRDSNKVAHALSKEASSKVIDLAWLEDIPSVILHDVLRDRLCP
jgi:hypothetical protein